MSSRLIVKASNIVRRSALDLVPNVVRMDAPLSMIVESGGNAKPQLFLFLLDQASNELKLQNHSSK